METHSTRNHPRCQDINQEQSRYQPPITDQPDTSQKAGRKESTKKVGKSNLHTDPPQPDRVGIRLNLRRVVARNLPEEPAPVSEVFARRPGDA
eukprot:1008438-Rhodomonas_salina.3